MSVIVRLDKCQASIAGNITSIQHTSTIDNGSLVNLGALISGETDVYTAATPVTATLATEEALLVYSPEVTYTPGTHLKDFTNLADTPARAYHVTVGDVITITDDGIDGTTVVGEYVITQDGSFSPIANSTIGSTRFSAIVIEKGYFGYTGTGWAKKASTTMRVVKA